MLFPVHLCLQVCCRLCVWCQINLYNVWRLFTSAAVDSTLSASSLSYSINFLAQSSVLLLTILLKGGVGGSPETPHSLNFIKEQKHFFKLL